MRDVDLVIPVYDGYEETRACLETVLATVDSSWVRIILVNDCSPDPQITVLLRALAKEHADRIHLLENAKNLGFVASVNKGMSFDPSRDVLLLNSDVEVAGLWVERLRSAAYSQDTIASVTPFSNNATICSFPNFCADNALLFGLSVTELDELFARASTVDELYDVPTGVGFCMFIRRETLDQVGLFDVDTFGRGYGEENDWCQRAEQAGWRNVHSANCFVYHKGAVSFGKENSPRVAAAMKLLDAKHPQYHQAVQDYVALDPAAQKRAQIVLTAFAERDCPKVAFISHKLGGGAQQHIDELAHLYADEALFVQITPEQEGRSVCVSVYDRGDRLRDGLHFDIETDYEQLLALLQGLGIAHVHFHHTMGVPARLWGLAADLGCEYDITVHDYYLLNANPTLTDDSARFVEEDAADFDARCAQHYPLPAGVDVQLWRQNQQSFIDGAGRVIFPSLDCQQRFERFYQLNNAIVSWHPDYQRSQPYPEPRWRASSERPLRVLVMGAISREKGADVLEAVAEALRSASIEFHLLGYAYRALSSAVTTHGPYENAQAYALIEEIDPDVVWYPALWPETYSYTLSLALHQGLPVVVPDIGAFVERVQNRPLSAVLPWSQSTEQWCAFWLSALEQQTITVTQQAKRDTTPAASGGFYQRDYLALTPGRRAELDANLLQQVLAKMRPTQSLSRKERVLATIWRWSRRPLIARLVALVPFRAQQAIKRFFSSKPMHDIVR